MAAGRRNDPNEYADTPNASVRSSDAQAAETEKADDPSALADPPVTSGDDPRVTSRTAGRDARAATTSSAGTPAAEPTADDEQVTDPDAPAEQGPVEVRCPPWRTLRVAPERDGEQTLQLTEVWSRVEPTDVDRVRRAARRSYTELRWREPQSADA